MQDHRDASDDRVPNVGPREGVEHRLIDRRPHTLLAAGYPAPSCSIATIAARMSASSSVPSISTP